MSTGRRRTAPAEVKKSLTLAQKEAVQPDETDYKAVRKAQKRDCATKGIAGTDELQRIALREQAAKLAAEQAAQIADTDAFEHYQRVQKALAEQKARVQRDAQAEALKELASRELARRSLLHFVGRMVPGYLPGWVHEDICRRLEKFLDDVHNKRSPRLLIAVPPRHGKSQIASVCFPAWALAQHPYMELITCSYNQSLAEKFSRQAKWCMDDPDYGQIFPGVQRDPKNDSIDQWGLLGERGGYVAAGVGGGVTGKGAHILTIDDPIKDAEQADSDTVKEGIWDWYGSTAYTRLAPGGGVLIIQTLWADDDLAGRVRQQMKDDPEADQFDVVLYPAMATEYEYYNPFDYTTYNSPTELTQEECDERVLVLRRRPGDALHRDRYDEKALARIKKTLHPRFWSALYQQNPVPDDGAYFKREWFRYAALPSFDLRTHWAVTLAWDFAITEKQESDYTVGSVAYQDYEGAMWPVEQVRFRSDDSDKIIDAMINLLVKHYRAGVVVRMGVEDGQVWKTMQAPFYRELKRRKLAHLAGLIEPMVPTTDKKVRATALQGLMKLGMVYWPAPRAPWQDIVEHEFLRFPSGAHDDCGTYETLVDCPEGQRQLGALRDGDTVLTYDGREVRPGTVTNHHCTGTKWVLGVSLSNGTVLELSEAHPVLTQRGYVYAGDLTDGDYIIRRDPCVSSATATSGPARVTATTSPQPAWMAGADGFISTPMLERLAKSRPAGTSTTKTATKTTTRLKTSNVCPLARTFLSMLLSELLPAAVQRSSHTYQPYAQTPSLRSAGGTSGRESCAPSQYACVSAPLAEKPSSSLARVVTQLRSALSHASRKLATKVQKLTGTRPSPASTAALSLPPASTGTATPTFAPRAAATSTAMRTSTYHASAAAAVNPCSYPQATPHATASGAELQEPAPTSANVTRAGERLYPATRMEKFIAIERALTTPEDLHVTLRAMRDTSRQFVKVESIREIGYRETYNFDVDGTRNYLVHSGHVIHNCIDSWGWNARLQTLHEPPRRPAPRGRRNEKTLEQKLKKIFAGQSGRSRSPMAA